MIRLIVWRRFRERHPEEAAELERLAEADLYPQVIEDFLATHPATARAW